jgi:hypothetical protein
MAAVVVAMLFLVVVVAPTRNLADSQSKRLGTAELPTGTEPRPGTVVDPYSPLGSLSIR